jgi:hypothetical protein
MQRGTVLKTRGVVAMSERVDSLPRVEARAPTSVLRTVTSPVITGEDDARAPPWINGFDLGLRDVYMRLCDAGAAAPALRIRRMHLRLFPAAAERATEGRRCV